MYGYIYKTTNLVNSKIYIGKRKGEFTPVYKGSGKYLKNAIKKYGVNNFYVELIEYCDSLETQNQREQYWIKYYNSQDHSIGYNIAMGGDGGDLVSCLSEDDYKKFSQLMSDLNKRGVTGNKGKHLSEAHKSKIGKGNKGKLHSKEWREKQSNSMKGIVAWNKGLTKSDLRVAKYIHKKGEFKHTEETKKLISEHTRGIKKPWVSINMRGRKWMNNGIHSIMVKSNDIENYKKQGYVEGRIKWVSH